MPIATPLQIDTFTDAQRNHLARSLYRNSGWQITPVGNGLWATPNNIRELRVEGITTATNTTSTLISLLRQAQQEQIRLKAEAGVPAVMSRSDIFALAKRLNRRGRIWQIFHSYHQRLVMFPGDDVVDFTEQHFLPWFFSRFPSGRVLFIRQTKPFRMRLHSVLKLFELAYDTRPAQVVKSILPRTLAQLHGFQPIYTPQNELSIFCGAFSPYLTGVPCGTTTYTLQFFFGEPWDSRSPVPESFGQWWRDEGVFSEEPDPFALWQRVAAHLPPPTVWDDLQPNLSGFEQFFAWYLARVTRIRLLSADFRLFSQGGPPNYDLNFQFLLTLQRIVVGTQLITSRLPPFLAKGLAFDVADQYSALRSKQGQHATFQRLFDSSQGGQWLASTLANIPGMGHYLAQKASEIFAALDASVTKGFYSGGQMLSTPQVLRDLRNTKHGYWLDNGHLESQLMHYDGNVADGLPSLSVLWWLAFIEDPSYLLGRGADHSLVV